ncbi:hypothetical protein CIPAW_11G067000 [Carya illinoinensis]|uniref:Uncharacterized protein n=1 Tax=Carya illinoinensis TaxID=32201 RepID=A0A8T1P213_CARIL|nr:hypothetical protein CIPAW_11G067000 [Carya illinoinensis]
MAVTVRSSTMLASYGSFIHVLQVSLNSFIILDWVIPIVSDAHLRMVLSKLPLVLQGTFTTINYVIESQSSCPPFMIQRMSHATTLKHIYRVPDNQNLADLNKNQ